VPQNIPKASFTAYDGFAPELYYKYYWGISILKVSPIPFCPSPESPSPNIIEAPEVVMRTALLSSDVEEHPGEPI
jgi:hypothetical protein